MNLPWDTGKKQPAPAMPSVLPAHHTEFSLSADIAAVPVTGGILPWELGPGDITDPYIAQKAAEGLQEVEERKRTGRKQVWTEYLQSSKDMSKLRPHQRALRETFCQEYLYDNNALKALIRCGYPADKARDIAPELFNEVGVQRRLKELMLERDNIGITRERILSGLLGEATNHGRSGAASARVASWAHIAKMTGVAGVDKSEVAFSGVMVVPSEGGVDSWEGKASTSQAKLKNDVRS